MRKWHRINKWKGGEWTYEGLRNQKNYEMFALGKPRPESAVVVLTDKLIHIALSDSLEYIYIHDDLIDEVPNEEARPR